MTTTAYKRFRMQIELKRTSTKACPLTGRVSLASVAIAAAGTTCPREVAVVSRGS